MSDKRTIDFSNHVQLYYQLYEILKEDIMNGKYKPKDMMPTEEYLTDKYNLSRSTVRRALDMLVQEDIISRKQGVGTFVNEIKESQPLDHIVHFIEDMKSKGRNVSTKLITNRVVKSTPELSHKLNIELEEDVVNIVRVRYVEDNPFCIESAYLPLKYCPEVIGKDFSDQSLRLFLESECNIHWIRAVQNIYARKAGEQAERLKIDENEPVLHIERTSYDQFNVPKEFLNAYYKGDVYYLTAEINAK